MPFRPEYTPVPEAGYTALFPGFELPNEVTFVLDGYTGFHVTGVVRMHGHRYELDELHVRRLTDGAEVTGTALREIKPPSIIRQTLRVLAPTDRPTSVAFGLFSPEEVEAAKAAGPTDETIRMVAKTYAAARAVQDAPAKAVQEVFGVSPRTAGNWTAKARAAGYLGEPEEEGR